MMYDKTVHFDIITSHISLHNNVSTALESVACRPGRAIKQGIMINGGGAGQDREDRGVITYSYTLTHY